MTDRTFRIRAFAALTGVTVRTLHHYDRLGLLTPRRTANNYRVYDAGHLPRLQHIVALKFIGLPLHTIKTLLRGSGLAVALRTQRALLERKRQLLDRAIAAVAEAEAAFQSRGVLGNADFTRIIEVIEMQNNSDAWQKQYEGLIAGKIQQLKAMSPETRATLAAAWVTLLKASRVKTYGAASRPAADPSSGAAAQAPSALGDPRVWAFMQRVLAARG